MNKLRNLALVLLLVLVGVGSAFAQNAKTTVAQVTSGITIDKPIDYVITGTTPFTTTGSIDIQNPDAAVIFQNINPQTVINLYLKKITVNGVALIVNQNCRASIYLHGTIVMPHSDLKTPDGQAFYPLTVYMDDNCTGESIQLNGDARKTSGEWVDKFRSFKLKRGYMLTVANMPDGTGYSHCYIANSKDIEVQLRKELAGRVGFLRIFRWQWPSKKGSCDVGPDNLRATWHYNWGAGTTSGTNYEYVPQRHHEAGESNGQGWKGAWESWSNINASDGTCTHVLGQNEPDNTSGAGEVYTYVTKVPDNHREKCSSYPLVDVAKDFLYSGKRIGTFACCNPNTGWVSEYVNWCRANNIRVDFVATHYYIGGQSPQGCIDRLWALYNATGLPVWATEWNNGANWSGESGFSTDAGWYTWGNGQDSKKNGEWLTDVLRRADKSENHWLERLAVYNAVETKREVWTSGKLSEGGQLFYDYNSTFAYDERNEYFMTWNHKSPSDLAIAMNNAKKTATLTWKHNNAKQTDSIYVERKLAGENDWTPVMVNNKYATSATLTFTDDLKGQSGIVTYRIHDFDSDGKNRYSGEAQVSLGSTQGNETIQYGRLTVANVANAVPVDFNPAFSERPSVFMGLLTFNNITTFAPPVFGSTAISMSKFEYIGIPWSKASGETTTYTQNEEIPFMAMTPGNYNFGTTDIEVGTVKIKLRDTLDVVFNQPYPEGVTPVVLAQVTTATRKTMPIMHKVFDVTNTGFKCTVSLEDIETLVGGVNQTLSYMAVTPGKACIDPESGLHIAAGLSDTKVYSTTRAINFFLPGTNAEGEAVNDTILSESPYIFVESQTANTPVPIQLRQSGSLTKTVTVDGVKKTMTYGARVKRCLDKSANTDKSIDASASADYMGWVVLYNQEVETPDAIGSVTISTSENPLDVKVINRVVYVDGYDNFGLYTLGGARAASNATQTPGIYIVRVGGKVAKIVVE